jgi:hypothetical protein
MARINKLSRKRVALVGVVMTAAVTGIGVTIAGADVPCGQRSNSTAFSRWGDQNNYFLSPAGNFEYGKGAGVDGSWAETYDIYSIDRTGGASRSAVDDPFDVAGPGAQSLQVKPGRAFVSPKFCVASDEESIRFVAKGPVGETIVVRVLVQSDIGWQGVDHVITGSGAWDVSPQLPIPNLRDASGKQWVNIKFGSSSGPGTWNVDNVMVDPWRTV